MSYTISHRQAGVTRADVKGLIRHEYRDVDRHNGKETEHSNERIVPSRTPLNHSVMFRDGEEIPLGSSDQIIEELDRRLESAGGTRTNPKTGETVRTKVRKDAKVVRNIILQLDPDFTRSSEHLTSDGVGQKHYEKVMTHLNEMIDYYGEVYGRHNLLAASLHLDERSPHIHLQVTPIDEKGRVRQSSFIEDGRGKESGLAKNDRAIRQYMRDRGYDADPEPTGANRSHMHPDDYAKWKQAEETRKEREVELQDKEQRLLNQQAGAAEEARKRRVELEALEREREEAWQAELARMTEKPRVFEHYLEKNPNIAEHFEQFQGKAVQQQKDRRPQAVRAFEARNADLLGEQPEGSGGNGNKQPGE